jgi:chromosome partitioning protein
VRVITLLNQKGGVGKTSTTHHLSGALAAMGLRVLLLDNDPQSSLSQGFHGPDAIRNLDPSETMAALYAGDRPFPSAVVRPTGIPGIDLVPGSRACTPFNVPEPAWADDERQGCLRAFLADVRGDYDLVLIDCPPNLHLCSWAALVASDHMIVPLQPEDYGAQGIIDVRESVAMVRSAVNPALTTLGYLLTMVAGKEAIHRAFEAALRAAMGSDVFAATVPRLAAYKEAIASRLPIEQHKPKGPAAAAIRAVAAELLGRLEAAGPAALKEAG